MIQHQWYAILPTRYVKTGQIVGVKRLNMNLAIYRDQEGILGCVVDQCSHRGAALSLGTVKEGCIKCPFHGIEFNHNGQCELIPANGKATKEDLSRYNVKHYTVKEANGIIYLWYGDDDAKDVQLPFFDEQVDASYVYSEIEDHWNAHYSRCIENQLDVVHLPFVHHNTIGRGNKTLVHGPKVIWENDRLITSANNEYDQGQMRKSAEECVINETYLAFMFPNIWMNHISEKVKVIIYFAPVDDENTILFIRFYCKLSKLKVVNKMIAYFGKYANRVIERQDKRVVITQMPKASAFRSGEKLVPGDAPIVMYRKIRDGLKRE